MERPTAEALFTRHHLSVYRFLRRMTGDASAAEDLTQDVFVRVVRGFETYDPRERELAWLFRIARNLLLDRGRTAARSPRLVSDEAGPLVAGPTQLVTVCVDQALEALPDAERESFLLREVAGLGYAEIAAICGVTSDAVRNRIYRARVALKSSLSHSLVRTTDSTAQEAQP